MALTLNLRDLINPQYTAVTGRRSNTPYAAYLTAMGPSVREAAQQDNLNALREKELTTNQNQFDQAQALEREKLDAAAKQNKISTALSGLTTAGTLAYLGQAAGLYNLKDVATSVKNKIWPAAPASPVLTGDAAINATGPGYNAGATLESGPLESMPLTTLPAGSVPLAEGSLVAGDGAINATGAGYNAGATLESGPLIAETAAVLPAGSVPLAEGSLVAGDGAINATGAGYNAGATLESGPFVSEAGADAGTTATGAPLSSYALPAAAAYVGAQVGDYAADQIGESIGTGGESERGFVGRVGGGIAAGAATGAALGAGVGSIPGAVVGGVVGGVVGVVDWGLNEGGDTMRSGWNNTVGKLTGDTWLCTEIKNRFGMPALYEEYLFILRRYSIKNHRPEADKYFKNGSLLVAAINQDHDADGCYAQLSDRLVKTCCDLVAADKLAEAYQHYKDVTEALCRQYHVDLTIKAKGREHE